MKSRLALLAMFGLLIANSGNLKAALEQEKTRDLHRIAHTEESDFSNVDRLALVIGNSEYEHDPLRNPKNDAKAMSAMLRKLNFEVIDGYDLDEKAMNKLIRQFGRRLKKTSGAGFFYYAGHGAQYRGENYLIPLGADIQEEEEIADHAVSANSILRKMDAARNKINIVVLDACRNNPFPRSFSRSGSGGLAAMDAEDRAVGTLIVYSTSKGKTAKDGKGRHSPFAWHLLEAMKVTGLEIEQLLKRVKHGVWTETDGKQQPWVGSGLRGSFYFMPPGDGVPVQPHIVLPEPVLIEPDYTLWFIAVPTSLLLFLGLLFYQRQRVVTATLEPVNTALLPRNVLGELYQGSAIAYLCNANSRRIYGPLMPDKRLVVGRSSKADITMHDEAISSRHLEIGWNPDRNKVWIKDLNSSNGVFIGEGKRIEPDENCYIAINDIFYLGKKDLAFILKEAAPEQNHATPME